MILFRIAELDDNAKEQALSQIRGYVWVNALDGCCDAKRQEDIPEETAIAYAEDNADWISFDSRGNMWMMEDY